MKIVLIGAGNVASHLGPLLKTRGHRIIQLYNRSFKNGLSLSKKLRCAITSDPEKIDRDADLYIIALRDEAVSSFIAEINFIPKLIVHVSGSIGIDVFPRRMKNTGVLYPAQTFSKNKKKGPDIIPFCIEGSNKKSLKSIRNLAKSISPVVYKLNSEERALIHLAAVFANNFNNYLLTLAEKILKNKNIPFEILRPLVMETAIKVQTDSPAKMQTGPAQRGDLSIIEKHLGLLKSFPEMKVIYMLLSKSISKEYRKRL